jgi:hypothetical protein
MSSIRFPAEAVDLMRRIYERLPHLPSGDEDARRVLIRVCGEQLCYSLGPRWGNKKRAGLSDAFRSKDAMAYLEDDGTCSVWDTQNGWTRELIVKADSPPDYPSLPTSEATFIPVEPINHLAVPVPQPVPLPPDRSLEMRVEALELAQGALLAHVNALRLEVVALAQALVTLKGEVVYKPLPRYVGVLSVFGYKKTIISTPES